MPIVSAGGQLGLRWRERGQEPSRERASRPGALARVRATLSTTLTRLAVSGEIAEAARGYQIRQESDTPVGEGADSAKQTGIPTEPASA